MYNQAHPIRWLAEEYCKKLPLSVVRLGENGIAKQIYLGRREGDSNIDYLTAFIKTARSYNHPTGKIDK